MFLFNLYLAGLLEQIFWFFSEDLNFFFEFLCLEAFCNYFSREVVNFTSKIKLFLMIFYQSPKVGLNSFEFPKGLRRFCFFNLVSLRQIEWVLEGFNDWVFFFAILCQKSYKQENISIFSKGANSFIFITKIYTNISKKRGNQAITVF